MTEDTKGPARKLASERLGPQRGVTLSLPLDERVIVAARKLHVSRALLLREAVRLGLKGAVDNLRRAQRQPERHAGTA